MSNVPATPTPHQPSSRAEATARAAAAGKAAAERGAGAQTTEAAVQAALTVAAERAAAKAEGAPQRDVQPVAQHTRDPEPAAEAEATEEPAKADDTEAAKKPELALRLKQKQRARALEFQKKEQELERERQQIAAERSTRAEEQKRTQYLDKLKIENPSQWLEEIGMTPEIHKRYLQTKIAEGKPEGQALKAESEAQRALRELNELKAKLQNEEQLRNNALAERTFVETAKAEDYPVLSSIYGDSPFTLVQQGYWAQQQFQKEHGRFASNEEILFNLECIEAGKVSRATGNEKLQKAVARTRETGDLKYLREAFGKPKASDKASPAKKAPPGPAAQSRTSQPEQGRPAENIKDRRAKAAAASRDAKEKLARGETRFDPAYLAGK